MDRRAMSTVSAVCVALAVVAFLVGDRLSAAAPQAAPGLASVLAAFSSQAVSALPADLLARPLWLSMDQWDLLCGALCACLPLAMWALLLSSPRPDRTGDANGSERLGRVSELRGYANTESPADNVILSRGVRVSTGGGSKKRPRNLNVCVLGGSGAGKTTCFLEPNILQVAAGARKDVVFSDPKGATIPRLGGRLVEAGADLVQLDLVRLDGAIWNPLAIIRSYTDVERVANALVLGANAGGHSTSEPIWDNGAANLAAILISYLMFWCEPRHRTMRDLQTLLGMCDFSGGRCGFDVLMDEIRTGRVASAERASDGAGALAEAAAGTSRSGLLRHAPGDPDGGTPAGPGLGYDYTLASWDRFRAGAAETLGSFKATLNQAIRVFCTPEVMRALGNEDGDDEVGLDMLGLGERPRVISVVASDRDHTLQPVLALFFWEAMYCSGRNADSQPGQRLGRHVQFLIDELYALGDLPDFAESLVTVRSRNISISFCAQSLAQLDERFEEHGAENIRDSCATTLYLAGSKNYATAKRLSEEIGEMTITKNNESLRNGKGVMPGKDLSQDVTGRPVFTPQEIGRLGGPKGDAALMMIGGEYATIDRKFRLSEHPAYDPLTMFDPNGEWPQGWHLFDYPKYQQERRRCASEERRGRPKRDGPEDGGRRRGWAGRARAPKGGKGSNPVPPPAVAPDG